MEIFNSIIILLSVGLGFYLARFNEVNSGISKKFKKGKAVNIAEPFVVATDEAKLEREQKAEEVEEEIINVKDYIK